MIYDIFISYRRKGGFFVANHMNDLLVRDGYTVCFDIDNPREGDFDEILYRRIEQCRDFLVIVDEHAFDRITNPTSDYDAEKDWMRKEIAYALNLKKNIVSVFLPGASYPQKMPADLEQLDRKNGPTYSKEYFGTFYEKLKRFLHSVPRNVQDSVRDNQGTKVTSGFVNRKVKTDQNTKKHFAFISYSRKDIEIALDIKQKVESICNCDCWMDMERIESGDQFEEMIVSAIENSQIVIFLMSKSSMTSSNTKKEVRYANSINKKIVPINIDKSEPKGWFLFQFGGINVIDYFNPEQKDKFLDNITEWSKDRIKKSERYLTLFTRENGTMPIIYLFLLIDTSGSMYGNRIETTNKAFSDVLSSYEIINPDIDVKIAVLEYGSSIRWMHATPISMKDFDWLPINANGLTQMGEALEVLNDTMNRIAFCNSDLCPSTIPPSLIILLTDGVPTDDYKSSLEKLSKNSFFRKSTKFAIGIGDGFDIRPLIDFTGNNKSVFEISDDDITEHLQTLLTRLLNIGLYSGSASLFRDD